MAATKFITWKLVKILYIFVSTDFTRTFPENTLPGTVVFTLIGRDRDAADQAHGIFRFYITSINGDATDQTFYVDAITGDVRVGLTLDFDLGFSIYK